MSEIPTSGTGSGRLPRFVPGLPEILAGRPVTGLARLGLGLFLLGVAILARNRVLATFSEGSLDDWLAFATLAAGLALVWGGAAVPAIGGWFRRWLAERPDGARVWSEFHRNRLAALGLYLMALLYLVTLLAPYLTPYDPSVQAISARHLPPSLGHPMGTDGFGRDVLTRILYGARVSLSIGFIAMGIAVTLGTVIGAVAGFFGRFTDTVLMRFVDMLISFPRLVLVIAVVGILQQYSIFVVIAVLGFTLWPGVARIVRGEVLSLREREFVQAARALGFRDGRIIFRHIVPNVLGPVIVAATLGIGNTILLEAGLSFLGFGVQPPTPSWGKMVAAGDDLLLQAWWVATFPGLAIVFTVVAFNLIGDGLRDALDPRLRA